MKRNYFETMMIDNAYDIVCETLYGEKNEKDSINNKLEVISDFLYEVLICPLNEYVYDHKFTYMFLACEDEIIVICGGNVTNDPYIIGNNIEHFVSILKNNYKWDVKNSKAIYYIKNMFDVFEKYEKRRVDDYYKNDEYKI